jgi:hypothetical protein
MEGISFSVPPNLPKGVRKALTTTTSFFSIPSSKKTINQSQRIPLLRFSHDFSIPIFKAEDSFGGCFDPQGKKIEIYTRRYFFLTSSLSLSSSIVP